MSLKIILRLVILATLAALVSCGKSREEERKALLEAHSSTCLIFELATPFLASVSEAWEATIRGEDLADPENWKKLKEVVPDIKGVDRDNIKSIREWYDAALSQSGKQIKESKPSNEDLKEAHEKLSDLHTKLSVIVSMVSAPSGTVGEYNEKLSEFNQRSSEILVWWKREMGNPQDE